jgi:ribosomal protein S8
MGTVDFLLGDMVARIKVGYITRKSFVLVLSSNFCRLVLGKLIKNGYLYGYEQHNSKYIKVFLKYVNGSPFFREIIVISSPRNVTFVKFRELMDIWRGSFILLSTSIGLLTRDEALLKGIGGIILLRIE